MKFSRKSMLLDSIQFSIRNREKELVEVFNQKIGIPSPKTKRIKQDNNIQINVRSASMSDLIK